MIRSPERHRSTSEKIAKFLRWYLVELLPSSVIAGGLLGIGFQLHQSVAKIFGGIAVLLGIAYVIISFIAYAGDKLTVPKDAKRSEVIAYVLIGTVFLFLMAAVATSYQIAAVLTAKVAANATK